MRCSIQGGQGFHRITLFSFHFKKDEVTVENIQVEARADRVLETMGNGARLDESELFYIKYDQAEVTDT